jgi:hypothetical protein
MMLLYKAWRESGPDSWQVYLHWQGTRSRGLPVRNGGNSLCPPRRGTGPDDRACRSAGVADGAAVGGPAPALAD